MTGPADAPDPQRMLEELRLREEQYRVIFEAASDAFVLRDAALRTVDANPAFYRMYGFEPALIAAGGGYPAAFPREYVEERDAQIRRALAGEETHVETVALRADGSPFWVDLRVVPVQYRGQPHVLQVVRDITAQRDAERERRQLEAQLRQVQKMEAIGQLTGGIAHDFNNILTSVIGYIVMALERVQPLEQPRLTYPLEQAHLAAQRARDLVAQMLTFARRTPHERAERQPLALVPVLQQSLSLLRSTLPSTIELHSEFADGLPAVAADPVQIEQVLFNLCINARDAMGGTGQLSVGLRRSPLRAVCASCRQAFSADWVELWVADGGSGIAPDVLERMFDPFYTTKDVGQGTGMGLAMVHGIVHAHGGHILVDSAVGRGSRFGVLLPPSAEPAAAAEQAPAPAAAAAQLRGRVLLVEDEAMVGRYMAELLGDWGLQVSVCSDALQARRLFGADPMAIDLVLTDEAMAGLTGSQLALQLLALRPGLPVLLYTGYGDDLDAAGLRRLGVRAVLHKPVQREQLLAALREHLP